MRRYLLQRLVAVAFVLVGVSFLVFLVLHLSPGDPAQILMGPLATAQDLASLRQQMGLDRPLPVQYGRWVWQVVHGDFGRSIILRRPVLPEVWHRFKATVTLSAGAIVLAFPIGTLIGILAAARRGTLMDRLVTGVAMIGISMP